MGSDERRGGRRGLALVVLAGCGAIVFGQSALASDEKVAETRKEADRREIQIASGREPARGETAAQPEEEPRRGGNLLYIPPDRGAPRARTGGGTRSTGPLVTVHALAPTHVARTAQSAPTLYWHLDAVPPAGSRVVFTLIDDDEMSIDPVASFDLPVPQRPGIHPIRLAEHGVALQSGTEYEWSVAVVLDAEKRAHDVVGRGWLDRVDAPGLDPGLATPAELAGRSLWYDALESLSESIEARPEDESLRRDLDALLEQADLGGLAR